MAHRASAFGLALSVLAGLSGCHGSHASGGGLVARESPPVGGTDRPESRRPAKADAITRELLDSVHERMYRPRRLGLMKVSFDAEVEYTGITAPRPQHGSLTYSWDGTVDDPEGRIAFSSLAVREAFERDVRRESLDALFKDVGWRTTFAGCTLTSSRRGDETLIEVEGENRDHVRTILLSGDGLPVAMTLATPGQGTANLTVEFVELDGKYSPSRQGVCVDSSGGEVRAEFIRVYRKVGEFHVWDSLTSRTILGGREMSRCRVLFSNYRFNSTEPAASSAAERSW